jgi:proteasome accessory factor C
MAERTPDRVVRLLGMVAYLDRHPGVPVEQLAEHFGVTPEQVLLDVDTLWMSGTPGYWPDDLIDFDAGSLDSGIIRLTQSRGLTHALRLGTREAVALVAALRALNESVGPALDGAQREVLTSTLATLTAATGEAAATVDVHLTVDARPEVLERVTAALAQGRQLHLTYVNAADETSERDVDPWQLLTGDDRSYLQAWCHGVGGERLFRLDRIIGAQVLRTPVEHPPSGAGEPPTFRPDDAHERVRIDLDGSARWVAEQLPVDEVTELPDGGLRVSLRVASPDWLRQLLLRVARDVRAVDPSEVGVGAAEAARRGLAAYDDVDARGRPAGEGAAHEG